jgi:predicted ATPase/DNA-binding SARP family transcriptional activator
VGVACWRSRLVAFASGVLRSFRVLGPVQAWGDDRQIPLGGSRQLKLFAFLLLNANRAVSVDALIDAVWGPERDGAVKRLQMAIARLRSALQPLESGGDSVLRTVSGGYLLSVEPSELDAEVFADRVQAGRRELQRGDSTRADQVLSDALKLWRGPPLADVAFEDFAQAEIRRLEELRLLGLEARAEAQLDQGHHAQLVGELEALSVEHPTRERLAGLLMLALYRAGRQAEALEIYQRTRTHLADQLGLEPGPALKELQTQILGQAPTLDAMAGTGRSAGRGGHQGVHADRPAAKPEAPDPPVPATPIIGREQEIAKVVSRLENPDVRLVTIIGPGGVGKTRLALAVTRALGASFADGVCWIELAGVAAPEDVAAAIARALAVAPLPGEDAEAAIRRYLAGRHMLLAADNFEHVIEGAELIARLLRESDVLTVLATSREPLNLGAEHRFLLQPLAPPAQPDRATVADVQSAPASALFLAAARRHDTDFEVSRVTASAVAQICARVDGLPLALELAAAHTAVYSVSELVGVLGDAFGEVAGAPRDAPTRHRTLRATIDWSYQLLNEQERVAFARFAVFAGGAAFGSARSVTGASAQTLGALTEKSLLSRRDQGDGTTRLFMLETIRHYALQRLAEGAERGPLRERHFNHYLRLAELAVPRLSTHGETEAVRILDREVDNIRGALQWALDASPALGLRLAGCLGEYWRVRRDSEGLRWLDAALKAAGDAAPLLDRARARFHHALQLSFADGPEPAMPSFRCALALYRLADDHGGISSALCSLAALVGITEGDVDGERRYAEAAVRHAEVAGDDVALGRALGQLAVHSGEDRTQILKRATQLLAPKGNYREIAKACSATAYVALTEGRVDQASAIVDAALEAGSKIDDPYMMAHIVGNVGLAKLFSGDLASARLSSQRSLQLCLEHAFREEVGETLAVLGAVAAAEKRDEPAARLLGAARALNYPPHEFDRRMEQRLERDYFGPARGRLGSHAWRMSEQAGAALSYEQAVAEALGASDAVAKGVLAPR